MVAFYNQRGKAEQYIKEGKNADQMDAAVVPQVSATMPSGSSFTPWPTISPTSCGHWLCRTGTLVSDHTTGIGAKVVSHGRYVTFQLAEVAVPRSLFQKILSLIDDLRPGTSTAR